MEIVEIKPATGCQERKGGVSGLKFTAKMSPRHAWSKWKCKNSDHEHQQLLNIWDWFFSHSSKNLHKTCTEYFDIISEGINWPPMISNWRILALLVRWVCHIHWEVTLLFREVVCLGEEIAGVGIIGVFQGAESGGMGVFSSSLPS